MTVTRTTTLAALADEVADLGVSADRLSSQALTGIPDLDRSVAIVASFATDPAYDVFATADLRAAVTDAVAAITAARTRIDDIREDALATHGDAEAAVAAYRAALHAAVDDPSATPSGVPDLGRFRVALDVHAVAFAAAERDLVAAIVAANTHATACRWPALQMTRSRWGTERARAARALAEAAEAVAALDAAESAALALDPVLEHRFDTLTRHVQDVSLTYRTRRDVQHALTQATSFATFTDQAHFYLVSDGWLRGAHRATFEHIAPEPLPVTDSPITTGVDVPTVSNPGYVPDPDEWSDGEWSDGFTPALTVSDLDAEPRPRARRRPANAEVTA